MPQALPPSTFPQGFQEEAFLSGSTVPWPARGLPVPGGRSGAGSQGQRAGAAPGPSGVWRLSGGRLLCVVSAVTPGEELCKYLHGPAALGAEFDGGLGSGEGGCGHQEGQRGGRGETRETEPPFLPRGAFQGGAS